LTEVLTDDSKLKAFRKGSGRGDGYGDRSKRSNVGSPSRRNSSEYYNEDSELERALAASRKTAQLETRSNISRNDSDEDLRKALELSRQDEEKRRQQQQKQPEIDFFSVAETPVSVPTFDFNAAANALQQQQMQAQQAALLQQQLLAQQQEQQQAALLFQQQQQARDLAAQQQAFLNQQRELLALQQQQQLQTNPFGGIVNQPTGDTRLADLQRNNPQLDPFANIALNRSAALSVTSTGMSKSSGTSFNPFGGNTAPQSVVPSSIAPSSIGDPFGISSNSSQSTSFGGFQNSQTLAPTMTGLKSANNGSFFDASYPVAQQQTSPFQSYSQVPSVPPFNQQQQLYSLGQQQTSGFSQQQQVSPTPSKVPDSLISFDPLSSNTNTNVFGGFNQQSAFNSPQQSLATQQTGFATQQTSFNVSAAQQQQQNLFGNKLGSSQPPTQRNPFGSATATPPGGFGAQQTGGYQWRSETTSPSLAQLQMQGMPQQQQQQQAGLGVQGLQQFGFGQGSLL
ncbi:hypothetical protein HK096_008785, partial [Nowakowskiella sp. JEL0078]